MLLKQVPANISCFPRRVQDVFSVTLFVFQDVFKTSSRRICNTSSWNVFKASSRRLQDVFARRLAIMYSRRLPDVLEDKKMLHWRRLQYVLNKTNVCWVVVGNWGKTIKRLIQKKLSTFCNISCSINKIKRHMLFTNQNFMFYHFTRKKIFCSKKWCGGGWPPPPPPPLPPFLYSPDKFCYVTYQNALTSLFHIT